MGSKLLQKTKIIKQTDILLWKIWGKYGSLSYLLIILFSCMWRNYEFSKYNVMGFFKHLSLPRFGCLSFVFDRELANAIQGITTSLFQGHQDIYPIWSILRHFMKWYNCIKSHHKGLGQVKNCFRMGKKNRKRNGKEKLKEKCFRQV